MTTRQPCLYLRMEMISSKHVGVGLVPTLPFLGGRADCSEGAEFEEKVRDLLSASL
jgi:hypothetical protein